MSSNVRIVNRSQGTLVGSEILLADSFLGRLQGFLGRPVPRRGEGILLSPCNAIHTIGMRFPLDVVFLDDDGRVLEALREVPPGRRSVRVPGGRHVLELPAGTITDTNTHVGDEMSWTPARGRRGAHAPGRTNGSSRQTNGS